MRFGFIAKYRGVWPVSWLCVALQVTCSGFYAWLKRPRSARAHADATLSAAIRRSFSDSDRTYGARRVRRDLREWGSSLRRSSGGTPDAPGAVGGPAQTQASAL